MKTEFIVRTFLEKDFQKILNQWSSQGYKITIEYIERNKGTPMKGGLTTNNTIFAVIRREKEG